MKSRLVDHWVLAAEELGFQIEAAFCTVLRSEHNIQSKLLVKNFGAVKGMLIFTDYAEISSISDILIQEGYGYSVLSEPPEHESYNQETYVDMLKDWGWTGNSADAPIWT